MKENLSRRISMMALKAMIYEVSTSPKPGLVDRFNNGSHEDMDYYLFIDSAYSFVGCLEEIVALGMAFEGDHLKDLFKQIREIGIVAEEKMFQATGGVNTHKGIIFSMCLICGAAGYLASREGEEKLEAKTICDLAGKMVEGITNDELVHMKDKGNFTHGENLFLKYKVTGIRGEAESGFKSVIKYSLPCLKKYSGGANKELVFIQTLLVLMARVEDTNILHRHDRKVLNEVQKTSKSLLQVGGIFQRDALEKLKILDEQFISKRISPGGSADLLAVTILLALIEGIEI